MTDADTYTDQDKNWIKATEDANKKNKTLSRVFMGVVVAGMVIGGAAEISKMLRVYWTPEMFNELPEYAQTVIRHYGNHVKGMGQAMAYAMAPNLFFSMMGAERARDRRDIDNLVMKDRSVAWSSAMLAGGAAWEAFSAQNSGVFDTMDMIWYAIGAAVIITAAKTAEAVAHKKPENTIKSPQASQVKADPKPATI